MKIAVFTLPEVLKSKNPNMVINDRYPFKDGEMRCVEIVARQIERTLCSFYGCSVKFVEAEAQRDNDQPTGSLAKVVTQSGVMQKAVEPPVPSTPAAMANVHAKPVENAPKSVSKHSVEDGIKAAQEVKANPVANNVSSTTTKPA